MSQSQPPSSPQQPKYSHLFDLFEPDYNQLNSRPNSTWEAEIVIIEGQELGDKWEETEGLMEETHKKTQPVKHSMTHHLTSPPPTTHENPNPNECTSCPPTSSTAPPLTTTISCPLAGLLNASQPPHPNWLPYLDTLRLSWQYPLHCCQVMLEPPWTSSEANLAKTSKMWWWTKAE